MLFDEPLAALDAGHKREILPYLEGLAARFGIPAIYVSHAAADMHLSRVACRDQQLTVPMIDKAKPGDPVRLAIRAGDVVLATSRPENLSVRNVLRGRVTEITPGEGSAFALVTVDIEGTPLRAQLTRHSIGELGLVQGMPVYALVKTATFDRGP